MDGTLTRYYIKFSNFWSLRFCRADVIEQFKNLGATGTYLYNTLKGLLTYEPQPVQVKCAEKEWQGTVAVAGFCNGRYFWGRYAMHLMPSQETDS